MAGEFDKTIETPKGVLKYRLPNIPEGFVFLSLIDKITNYKDALIMKGKFAEHMDKVIDWAGLGYPTYTDFLKDKENNYKAVSKIADEIYVDLGDTLGKKN